MALSKNVSSILKSLHSIKLEQISDFGSIYGRLMGLRIAQVAAGTTGISQKARAIMTKSIGKDDSAKLPYILEKMKFTKNLTGFQNSELALEAGGENVKTTKLFQEVEYPKRSFMSMFVAFIGSGIFLWISNRKYFTVDAAKPIYDYENEQKLDDRSRSIDEPGNNKQNTTSIKKKKSNRDRYNFIADVVEAVGDTVVSIEIKDHASIDWFTGVPQTASNGSGFIISKDGLILTNAHVVAGHKKASISVRLSDGRSFAARIEDVDFESDLATVRINAMNLPTMPLGSSSETKIGEWVVALGSPLTLVNTITAGVVSSVSRGASELGIRNDINYIQTDAAITFGNSGGPLINLDGEAIGINSMKVTAGISFAIPIDHAKMFLARSDARKSAGKKQPARSYLGITILTVTEQIKRELQSRGGFTDVKSGVLVWQVVVGSPAYLAGIQPGDIIIRINNTDIKTSADLYETVRTSDKLNIHVQRGDKVYACIVSPEFILEE